MKHKHAELIHAWADGAEIEMKMIGDTGYWGTWRPFDGNWKHEFWWEYRIKPKPRGLDSSWLEDSTIVSIGGIRPKELKSYIDSLERRISMLEASR